MAAKKRKSKRVVKGSFSVKGKRAKRSRAHDDDEVITGSWDDEGVKMKRKRRRRRRRRNPDGMDGVGGSAPGGKEVSMLPMLVVGGLAVLALYLVMRKPQPKIESAFRS